eukprot:gene18663-25180_t
MSMAFATRDDQGAGRAPRLAWLNSPTRGSGTCDPPGADPWADPGSSTIMAPALRLPTGMNEFQFRRCCFVSTAHLFRYRLRHTSAYLPPGDNLLGFDLDLGPSPSTTKDERPDSSKELADEYKELSNLVSGEGTGRQQGQEHFDPFGGLEAGGGDQLVDPFHASTSPGALAVANSADAGEMAGETFSTSSMDASKQSSIEPFILAATSATATTGNRWTPTPTLTGFPSPKKGVHAPK